MKIALAPSETKPMTRIGSDEDDDGIDAELSNEELQDTAVSHDYGAYAAVQLQDETAEQLQDETADQLQDGTADQLQDETAGSYAAAASAAETAVSVDEAETAAVSGESTVQEESEVKGK